MGLGVGSMAELGGVVDGGGRHNGPLTLVSPPLPRPVP